MVGSFYVIFLNPTLEYLPLPTGFPADHYNNLPVKIIFTKKKQWDVVFRNVEGVMSICDGWTDVVRDVPIQPTYLLYFQPEDERTFRLDVYNANGCCIKMLLPEVKIEPDQSDEEDFMEIDGLDTQNPVPKPIPVQAPPHPQYDKIVVARQKFRIPQRLSKLAGFYNYMMLNLVYGDEDGELYEVHAEWNMGYTRFNVYKWEAFASRHEIEIGSKIRLRYDFENKSLHISAILD